MSLDQATVARIAHLARIKVPEAELGHLAGELSQILTFVEQLGEVDVTGVEPMTSATPQKLRRRADVVTDGDRQEAVVANGPETAEGYFVVPKVVE